MKCQKILACIAVVMCCIQMFQPLTILACGNQELDVVEKITAEMEAANSELMEKGAVSLKLRASNQLVFPYQYYQSGQSWSNDIMQEKGLKIGEAGCCLTSFAMIQRFYGGSLNPGQVNTKLGNAACLFNYETAARIFGYEIVNSKSGKVSDSDAIKFIVGGIDSARPILVGMTKSNGGTHFVVAYGYSGSTIFIKDPSGKYTTLNSYLDSGCYVDRLYIYAK